MKTELILRKVSFLRAALEPDWADGDPGQPGPIFRVGIADYVVAELLRDISANLQDREFAETVHGIGKELVASSSHAFIASWEDGDDICPPWPRPRPIWNDDLGVSLNPEPVPWLQGFAPAMNDVLLAQALRQLASLTSSERASDGIRLAGEAIVKAASSKLFDEYCGTPVKPHVPIQTPNATAA